MVTLRWKFTVWKRKCSSNPTRNLKPESAPNSLCLYLYLSQWKNGNGGRRENNNEQEKSHIRKQTQKSHALALLQETHETRSQRLGTQKSIRLRVPKSAEGTGRLLESTGSSGENRLRRREGSGKPQP